jgi:hypothetical protein
MNEQELREMVRQAIARQHAGHSATAPTTDPMVVATSHAAFARLPLVRGGDDDGNCIIESAVRCNHCGYCQSFGH